MAAIQSPPPSPSFLPDSHGWSTDLWMKEVHRPENLELTRQSVVIRIVHRKVRSHVEHEYIDVGLRVAGKSGDATAWIRVERNGCVPQAASDPTLLPTPNPRASSSSLNSVSSTSSSLGRSCSVTAHDTVRLLLFRKGLDRSLPPTKEVGDREISTIVLSEDRELSVAKFAVLLQSISKRAPEYDVIFKNCYWYAGAACECVCREYPYLLKQDKSLKQDKPLKQDKERSTLRRLPLGAKLTPKSAFDELHQAWQAEAATLENLKTKQEIDEEATKKLNMAVDAAVKEEERKRDEAVEEAVEAERRKGDEAVEAERRKGDEAVEAERKKRDEAVEEAVEAERRKRDEAEHKLKDLEAQLKRLQAISA